MLRKARYQPDECKHTDYYGLAVSMPEKPNQVDVLECFRKSLAEGLIYTHARLSETTSTNLEVASFLYGLIELLEEKGLVSIQELDDRKREVSKRLVKKNSERGIGVLLQEPEYDKYSFKEEARVDCEKRIPLCKAACCRLPFALSKQDLWEGIVHWDLGQPYIIAQEPNGYCTHLEPGVYRCSVREHRPVPCRAFDCRKGNSIWMDFDKGIINPIILNEDWPRCASPENKEGASP